MTTTTKRKIALLLIPFLFIVACNIPRTLKPVDIQQSNTDKTILVDHIIWRYRIPEAFEGWYNFQKLKPYIGFKLEDYFQKAGWKVVDYHDYFTNRIFKVSNKVFYNDAGEPDLEYWLSRSLWTCKLKLNDKIIKNLLDANYMLSFFVYPNPKNIKEYKITAILLKFKSKKERLKFLAKKKNIVSFNDLKNGGMVEKEKLILYNKDLLITNKKAVDYTATAIFMALKEKGFL